MRTRSSVRTRRISYFLWVQAFIIAAAILFCLAAASITALKEERRKRAPENEGYSISRQIRYSFTLQNRSNRAIERAELWTFAPVKLTATQRCLNLQANYPYRLHTDDSGNQVLHFEFDNLAPYASRVIAVKADLMVSGTANPMPYTPEPRDVNPQKFIESDHPTVGRVASRLCTSNKGQTVKNIFGWVTDNLRYSGYDSRDRGALFALENKKGDCTEYAELFVALCRANGIAARPVGGYVCPRSAVLNAHSYHNWGEFRQNGTWQVADPQHHVLTKTSGDYIAMRIIHAEENSLMGLNNRFQFRGKGLKVYMN